MDEVWTSSACIVPPGTLSPQDASGQELTPQSRLLSLPAEVRLLIYRLLFSNLRVTVQPRQPIYRGPGSIITVCRLFYLECLPIFYELVTIVLKHEAYLYVLRRKIGPHNMARIRSIVIGGFDSLVSKATTLQLPDALEKLCIGWKGGTPSEPGAVDWEWPLSDDFIRTQLDESCRQPLDSCMKDLWTKNLGLQIFLEGWIGKVPSSKVCPPRVFLPLPPQDLLPWKQLY